MSELFLSNNNVVLGNGGWSGWTSPASCPVMCGGGFLNITRTCSNPYRNERGSTCTCKGEAFDVQTCNTHDCVGKYPIEKHSSCTSFN